MATYRATQPIFLAAEGRYIVVGEEFTTDIKPGTAWEPLDDEAKAKVAALGDEPEPKPEPARTTAAKPKGKVDDPA